MAERRLELRTEKGAIEVIARLGSPKEVGIDEWTCSCITKFADEERSVEIHGWDSMQALQFAMATLTPSCITVPSGEAVRLTASTNPSSPSSKTVACNAARAARNRCQMAPDT